VIDRAWTNRGERGAGEERKGDFGRFSFDCTLRSAYTLRMLKPCRFKSGYLQFTFACNYLPVAFPPPSYMRLICLLDKYELYANQSNDGLLLAGY